MCLEVGYVRFGVNLQAVGRGVEEDHNPEEEEDHIPEGGRNC